MTKHIRKTTQKLILLFALAAVTGLISNSAHAAIDGFMKIDGVQGNSVVTDHAGEIDVLSWSWGMSQPGNSPIGTVDGASEVKVSVQDISFTMRADAAALDLMQACSSGQHFASAKLSLRKAGTNPLDYITIELKNVLVTSVSTSTSGSRLNVTLNFSEFKYTYQPQDKTGARKGGAIETGFNIAYNSSI